MTKVMKMAIVTDAWITMTINAIIIMIAVTVAIAVVMISSIFNSKTIPLLKRLLQFYCF